MKSMKVILQESIRGVGKIGQTVVVSPGHARNFLFPQKKALRATTENLKIFEEQKAHLELLYAQSRSQAESVSENLNDHFVLLIRQAGKSGQLYGSVSARDIAESLSTEGYPVKRDQVVLDSPLRSIGYVRVNIELHAEVFASIHVIIAQSMEEALFEKQQRLSLIQGEDTVASTDAA